MGEASGAGDFSDRCGSELPVVLFCETWALTRGPRYGGFFFWPLLARPAFIRTPPGRKRPLPGAITVRRPFGFFQTISLSLFRSPPVRFLLCRRWFFSVSFGFPNKKPFLLALLGRAKFVEPCHLSYDVDS